MARRLRIGHHRRKSRQIEYDGHVFDSRVEWRRYCVLRADQEAGRLTGLEVHPKFSLYGLNRHRVGDVYTADFRYVLLDSEGEPTQEIVEDVKGSWTKSKHGWAKTRDLMADNYPSIEFYVVECKRGAWVMTLATPRSRSYRALGRVPDGAQKGE